MRILVNQAMTCWAAARTLELAPFPEKSGPSSHTVHAVANGMDCCTSYSTHKYIDRGPIEAFMGTAPGRGVVGFWRFRDGSRLVHLCSDWDGKTLGEDKFCLLTPAVEAEADLPAKPALRIDLRSWGADDLRREEC